MNSLIRIGILWCLAISTGRAQEAVKFLEASQTPTLEIEPPSSLPASEPTPLNGQPSAYRPSRPAKSESPKRTAEPKRIVIQPGVDAQESEVVWQFLADLEKAGIAKVSKTEMTPTSESPIVTQVFMREDESFEKIKLFLVDLRASGVEKLVLEFGGLHPEGDADKQHNGLVFRATKGYSQDELQRLEKVVQAAAERCVLSFYLPGTHVLPSGPEFFGPPDEAASPGYTSIFRPTVPQLQTDYEAANQQAHDLAESLRQTPDAAKKSDLRTAVQRAFTLRQSLLRAELQEMQARLEKTQQSLAMRDRMADQIVDRRVEDLLNPELKWEQKSNDEMRFQSEVKPTAAADSREGDNSGVVTELEGDWHRVAYIDKWQTERRPVNMTIRANQENSTLWTGESCSRTVVIDQNAKTIEIGPNELKGGRPNQVVSERGTYTLSGDLLTIHSEYTVSDAVNGSVIQKGQHTNIWKRGLSKIENYDSRNPGHGMGICHVNGIDENTGLGKLIPGDNVDVLVSFASKEGPPVQRVLVENIEVDGSSEPKQNPPAKRQLRLLGTREQCLIIDDANMRGVTLSVSRRLDGKTQQFAKGINAEAVKEMKEMAPQKSLDVSEPNPFP